MMRIAFIAASFCLTLAACGGPETSQANNGQANISNSASPPATASQRQRKCHGLLAAAPTKAKALAIMHERHEGMETIGKTFKALHRELDAAAPDLGVIRASAAKIAELSQKASGWFAKGTGPKSERPAPSPTSGKIRTISRANSTISRRGQGVPCSRCKRRPQCDQGSLRRTSARPARRATTNIGRR